MGVRSPISSKLGLLFVPVGIVGTPILLLGLFLATETGTRLLSSVIGPVNIWNAANSIPPDGEVLGHYRLTGSTEESLHAKGIFISGNSGFTLEPNHKLEVIDLPAFDEWGKPRDCNYNGNGTWSLYGPTGEISLTMDIKVVPATPENLKACGTENAGLMTLLGHSAPHRFWYVIGDPDEDEGLLYKKD